MKSIHDVLFDLSFADVFIFSEFVWRGLICARVQAQLRFQKGISEIEFCRLVAAGIVSTNLYLKNLRFVNWKPGIEFTS